MLSIDSVLRGLFFPNQICNLFCQHSSAEVIQRACCPYLVRLVVFSKFTACIHFRSKTVIEMPPKKSHKVNGFKSDWTKEFGDGYCVGSWVTSDQTSTMKARCLLQTRKKFQPYLHPGLSIKNLLQNTGIFPLKRYFPLQKTGSKSSLSVLKQS